MNGASSSLRTAFSYCVQQVRNYDYHHYLCLLELPPNIRKAAFALRAFNVETARAMDVASDPRIGLMRLLWWQEAIDKIYANKVIEHPAAQALSSVISENGISKGWLKRPVEARINDARREVTDIPETIEELEKYAEDTVSTLLYMTLQAGGIRSTAADHAASHAGKASGLLFCCLDHFHIMLVATDTFVTYQLKWQPNMGCWLRREVDLKSAWIYARVYVMLYLIWHQWPMFICRRLVHWLEQSPLRLVQCFCQLCLPKFSWTP